jgi:hypothetical protein
MAMQPTPPAAASGRWLTPVLAFAVAAFVLLVLLPWQIGAVPQHDDRSALSVPPAAYPEPILGPDVPSAASVFAGREIVPEPQPPTFSRCSTARRRT